MSVGECLSLWLCMESLTHQPDRRSSVPSTSATVYFLVYCWTYMTNADDATALLRMLSPCLPLAGETTKEAATTLLRHGDAFCSHLAQAIARSLRTDTADVRDIFNSLSLCAVFACCDNVPFTSTAVDGAEQLLKSLLFRCKLLICSDVEVFNPKEPGVQSNLTTITTLVDMVQYVNRCELRYFMLNCDTLC